MDKISGIIPQTPRTGSKRFNDNTPVRPGAPQFGRPEGSSEIKDRVSITNVQSVEMKPYKNPREANHVKIADSLTRKFFLMPEKEKPNDPMDSLNEVPFTEPDFDSAHENTQI